MDIPQIVLFLICWIVVFWILAMRTAFELADLRVRQANLEAEVYAQRVRFSWVKI